MHNHVSKSIEYKLFLQNIIIAHMIKIFFTIAHIGDNV